MSTVTPRVPQTKRDALLSIRQVVIGRDCGCQCDFCSEHIEHGSVQPSFVMSVVHSWPMPNGDRQHLVYRDSVWVACNRCASKLDFKDNGITLWSAANLHCDAVNQAIKKHGEKELRNVAKVDLEVMAFTPDDKAIDLIFSTRIA